VLASLMRRHRAGDSEETELLVHDVRYIVVSRLMTGVPGEVDCIKTMFFVAEMNPGQEPKAADDIAEVRWFRWRRLQESDVERACAVVNSVEVVLGNRKER